MVKNHIVLSLAVALLLFASVATIVATNEATAEKEQIILNPNNIKELKAFGETDKPWYPENYPPEYIFDNLINSYSFWTQQGNSGFNLILKEKLEQPICSIEIGSLQPQNQPFSLAINDKIVNGTLNSETVQINFANDQCVSNVNKLSMNFTPSDSILWTTLSEIKLFSDTKPEPPPVVLPGNVTKFIITNSTVTIDLENSEVIFKQPAAKQTTPIGTPLPAEAKEDKEEDENEDDGDENEDKKEKDNKN